MGVCVLTEAKTSPKSPLRKQIKALESNTNDFSRHTRV